MDDVSVYTLYRLILELKNRNRYREGKNGIGKSLGRRWESNLQILEGHPDDA